MQHALVTVTLAAEGHRQIVTFLCPAAFVLGSAPSVHPLGGGRCVIARTFRAQRAWERGFVLSIAATDRLFADDPSRPHCYGQLDGSPAIFWTISLFLFLYTNARSPLECSRGYLICRPHRKIVNPSSYCFSATTGCVSAVFPTLQEVKDLDRLLTNSG